MPDYVVTGKKGNGKTLSMIDLIRRAVCDGRRVATNLDLFLEHLFNHQRKDCNIIRVPDLPTSADLELLGVGNPSRNESMNGILILDEMAISMNARGYQAADRQKLLNWFIEARKGGWDIYYIAQDLSMLDKQLREGLAEHVVYCRRLDRVSIPFIGSLWKLITGYDMRMPRFHIANIKYGAEKNSPSAGSWKYNGSKYFDAYDTRQKFRSDYPHGVYSYCTPYILTYRSFSQRTGEFYMRLTKIYFRQWSHVSAFFLGLVVSLSLILGTAYAYMEEPEIISSAVISVSDTDKDIFQDLKIVSYSVLPAQPIVFYMEGKKGRFTNTDLMNRGFSFTYFNKKHISFSKGDFNADIYNY